MKKLKPTLNDNVSSENLYLSMQFFSASVIAREFFLLVIVIN